LTAELLIAYEPSGGRALALARVHDPDLLRAAGRAAVAESKKQGERLAEQDATLGRIVVEETRRLQRTLKAVGAL
jgi:hypothetical protein